MPPAWSHVSIADRPARVFDPLEPRPRFALLFLHDLDGEVLSEGPVFTRLLTELSLACICPEGGRCWWTGRPSPEFHAELSPERYLLDAVLPFCAGRWGVASRGVGLLGIGAGGQGALRLAFRYPEHFPAVAGIGPALDFHEAYGRGTPLDDLYESREHCRQDTALLHVNPTNFPPHVFFCAAPDDPWYRGNDRLHEKLSALGLPHEADLTTGSGGNARAYIESMAERAVRFLHASLVQESRRLL
jgi:S-formylglutathione hydrolase